MKPPPPLENRETEAEPMREIVTFDAYATLINFELAPTTLKVLEDRLVLD